MPLGILDVLGSVSGGLADANKANALRRSKQKTDEELEQARREKIIDNLSGDMKAAVQAGALTARTPEDFDILVRDSRTQSVQTAQAKIAKTAEEAAREQEVESLKQTVGTDFLESTNPDFAKDDVLSRLSPDDKRLQGTDPAQVSSRIRQQKADSFEVGEPEIARASKFTSLQNFLDFNEEIRDDLADQISKKDMAARDNLVQGMRSLKDEDSAKSLIAEAKEKGFQDVVNAINERVTQGFEDEAAKKKEEELTALMKQKRDQLENIQGGVEMSLLLMKNPDIRAATGGGSAIFNTFRLENPWADAIIKPFLGGIDPNFVVMQEDLTIIAEEYLRMKTGAAAPDPELLRFAARIVGNMKQDPEVLERLLGAFNVAIKREQATLGEGKLTKVGIRKAKNELLKIINDATNPSSVSEEEKNAMDEDDLNSFNEGG